MAAFRRLLPLESKIIHVRWSGEAGWIPFGDLDLGLGPENATCYPHPGEIVLYPGGVSETEILLAYGYVNFASKAGQLAGNHFATVVEGTENLRPLGVKFLWEGAQEIVSSRTEPGREAEASHQREAAAPPSFTRSRAATGLRERADRLAAPQQLGDGGAPFVAVVLGQLVDVHLDEAVGDRLVDAAPELQRVLERLVAVLEPAPDRLAEHLGELADAVDVAAHDVDAERQRQAGLEQPPLAEVEHLVQPEVGERELALVDQEAVVGAARRRPRPGSARTGARGTACRRARAGASGTRS